MKGSIYPKRPAVIQMRTSDGWKTLRKVTPTRERFQVTVPHRPHRPGHAPPAPLGSRATRSASSPTSSSRQRGVLIYDRFVVR